MTALLLAGGGAFMLLDRRQALTGRAAPQFSAMAADFLPESLAWAGSSPSAGRAPSCWPS